MPKAPEALQIWRRVVPTEWIDYNGHLTEGYYGVAFADASDELLIYLGFGLLPMHGIPVAALGLMVAFHWVPNMLRKDRSLARYPEFEAYAKKSWRFIPLVW